MRKGYLEEFWKGCPLVRRREKQRNSWRPVVGSNALLSGDRKKLRHWEPGVYESSGLSYYFFGNTDRSRRNMETNVNNADFGRKKSKRQHCTWCVYYLPETTTRTSNLKNTVLARTVIELQSNPPKRPQCSANDLEGLEYRRHRHMWILTTHEIHLISTKLDLQLSFYRPLCHNSRALMHCLRTSWRTLLFLVLSFKDRLVGLGVSMSDYWLWGRGFDPRHFHKF